MTDVFWKQLLHGLWIYIAYYGILASLAFLLRYWMERNRIPAGEPFRKLLHLIQVNSIWPLLYGFASWKQAVLVQCVLMLVVYFLLVGLEKWKPGLFGRLILERKNHEGFTSMLSSFGILALLTAVFWGLFGEKGRSIVLLGVQVWGWSDMMAALVGKRFGRHHFQMPHLNTKKSWEGSAACFLTSLLLAVLLLQLLHLVLWPSSLLIGLILALVSAVTELITPNGQDTWSVPSAVCITVCLLLGL